MKVLLLTVLSLVSSSVFAEVNGPQAFNDLKAKFASGVVHGQVEGKSCSFETKYSPEGHTVTVTASLENLNATCVMSDSNPNFYENPAERGNPQVFLTARPSNPPPRTGCALSKIDNAFVLVDYMSQLSFVCLVSP